ncbi:glutamine synthetase III [Sedimentisphaera salicampi]|uniref:Glutamine synthetase n=1 Tax=Sedimentisphaera salicampi TaxID=1941349 RepID=A0A1W6LMW9_9BACT|nr:glutamine synthetase III [Sedimentisphaera salicampi]ARN57125.1 Glutamine synthetase [Sedimentisphaera salicampi]
MSKDAKKPLSEMFGSYVFNDAVMRERLPKTVYKAFKKTVELGEPLDVQVADVIASAMKDWAVELGATHYCHWFQPMTGATAEKHDSFISPTPEGRIIMEFSGKELIQGEPDASSFPSGGLRATFEARGYTAWDCTSPVFCKKDGDNVTMFIPCAFISYTGQVLDKKTPLLRSMEAVDKQATRVLKALGNTTSSRVNSTLGAEQEYFLVDKEFVDKRLDLLVAGRTLFGESPSKGQELDDHYFGQIESRVASFMACLNRELWKLGITAKTQHNEVSPAQYEIAPVFASVNVAVDHNQLTMETLKRVAREHGFVCLLHEKPFAGLNGSGKHNNWSLSTDDGINLLNPGDTPHENMQFLVFLFAVIRAVDKYADLLRTSVASASNDHRLGANEAPPAIISIFLGEQLTEIYEQIKSGGPGSSKEMGQLKLGVSTLPQLPQDCTDRNRTSPFAFTGNRFEFRMPGSLMSLSGPNFVLNTIVADVLEEMAEKFEKFSADSFNAEVQKMLHEFAVEHEKVVFNGDNYTDQWEEEAEKRGLPNLKNTVDALASLDDEKNISVFERQKVLNSSELSARQEILYEQYASLLNIEALAALNMAKREILPAAVKYSSQVAASVNTVSSAGIEPTSQRKLLVELNDTISELSNAISQLETACSEAKDIEEPAESAKCYRDKVIPGMTALREAADKIEGMVDADIWPLPTYADMLFKR